MNILSVHPVSYTHLDVYTRQGCNQADASIPLVFGSFCACGCVGSPSEAQASAGVSFCIGFRSTGPSVHMGLVSGCTDGPVERKQMCIRDRIYGAKDVEYSPTAEEQLEQLTKQGMGDWPVCMAKTQMSLSDDAKQKGRPRDFTPVSYTHLKALLTKGKYSSMVVISAPNAPRKIPLTASIMEETIPPIHSAMPSKIQSSMPYYPV